MANQETAGAREDKDVAKPTSQLAMVKILVFILKIKGHIQVL